MIIQSCPMMKADYYFEGRKNGYHNKLSLSREAKADTQNIEEERKR